MRAPSPSRRGRFLVFRQGGAYNFAMLVRMLKRRRRVAVWAGIVGLVGLAGLACSKPSNINPADAARVRKIDATVEKIRQAYTNKDFAAFREMLMPLERLRQVEAAVERDFAVYDRISLDMTIDRVMIDGPDIAVYFHWQGQWQRKADEQPFRERGHAILRLAGEQTLAVSAVDGDAPFGIAGRRVQGEGPRGQ